MIFVVGSGPAGVAAAVAMLRAGRQVTMLDAGLELEPAKQQLLKEMRQRPDGHWDDAQVERIKEGMTSNSKGVAVKLAYGSDYPYRGADAYLNAKPEKGVDIKGSLARGGFSTVWGAALMPYRAEDIPSWPIGVPDLADHYRAVLSFMKMSARKDDLESLFPLYTDDLQHLESSPQAQALLADMSKHRESLRSAGIHFGTSRLALEPQGADGRPGCAYCGLCMYGCPYELIYSTDFTLGRLLKDKNFTYVKNAVVERVQEKDGAVTITASDRSTGEPLRFEGDRVCLAAGPLATTRILLESMQAYGQPIEMCDSQIFLVPLLRYGKSGRASSHSLHTLSQLFIEILDSTIVPYTTQLQVYTYNDLYLGAMKDMFGRLYPLLKLPIGELLDRMLVLFGYIHSDFSPKLRMVLDRPSDGNRGQLHLSVSPREADTRAIIRRVLKKVWRCRKYLRGIPLTPMLNVTPTGRSFHSGGTFPMSASPKGFQSDTLGRPCGFTRVHAVDSTVFPSVPATTITLTVMANAHRIGTVLASM